MTDPRAFSAEKLPTTTPLPYISRRALKRIPDFISPPDACRYCGGAVEIADNSEVYGKSYGEWPYCYLCRACGAYVGLHPDTDLPLGTMADKSLRQARKSGKNTFYALIKKNNWDRDTAYAWLSDKLGIPKNECHWGMFEADQCERAQRLCNAELIDERQQTVTVPLRPTRAHLECVAILIRPDFYHLNAEQQNDCLRRAWHVYQECTGRGSYKLNP